MLKGGERRHAEHSYACPPKRGFFVFDVLQTKCTMQVVVSEREPEDAALRRFRRECQTAKIVHEVCHSCFVKLSAHSVPDV